MVGLAADPAFAVNCNGGQPQSGTVTCDSSGNPYPAGISFAPPADLTVVLAPGVVVTSGADGLHISTANTINLNATIAAGASVSSNPVTNSGVYVNLTAGTVTLTNNGVVNGGNPGVFVETLSAVPSTTSISITNANQITSAQDAGITALAFGGGPITIANNGTITSAKYGISATIYGNGNITVTNTNQITSTNGEGIRSQVTGTGTISITNAGPINSVGSGVYATSFNAQINIANTNQISSTAGDGIFALSIRGPVTITNSGSVTSRLNGLYGVSGYGGVVITNTGAVNSVGSGIKASAYSASTTAAVTVTNSGTINTTGNLASGIVATTKYSAVTVTNNKTITTQGGSSAGIGASSTYGAINIVNSGTIKTIGGGGSNGIQAYTYKGSIAITNSGAIATAGYFSHGIYAKSYSGPINIANAGGITVTGTASLGIFAISQAANMSVVNGPTGTISTTGNGLAPGLIGSASGIVVVSAYYGGSIAITNQGSISTKGRFAAGIFAYSLSGSGPITIANSGAIATQGFNSPGIVVTSLYGAAITITSSGSVATKGNRSSGIAAYSDYGAITITHSGTIGTQGFGASGITAFSDGGVAITNSGNIATAGGSAHGIAAKSNYGSITIVNSGAITTQSIGLAPSHGINAYSYGGAISIVNSGTITTLGRNSHGIYAYSSYGNVMAGNSGTITAGGAAMLLSTGGSVTITNSGTLFGNRAGVVVYSGTGATLNNSGTISAGSDLAVASYVGPIKITNTGTIIGNVLLTGGNDVVNNQPGGLFAARGNSTFGGSSDVFNNAGTFSLAPTGGPNNVTLVNLGNFNNSGLVTMVNGAPVDKLTISGNFNAVGTTGRLAIDAFLGAASNSKADLLAVNGNVTGATGILVSNTNPGQGAFNSAGIPVVNVAGSTSAGNFFLPNGPIQTGLFQYDLFLLPGGVWALESAPSAAQFELPRFITGAQSIWYQTTGDWLDRTGDLRNQYFGWSSPATSYAPLAFAPPDRSKPSTDLGPAQASSQHDPSPIWARASGDFAAHNGDAATSFLGRTYNFNLDYNQSIFSYQMGIDGARHDVLGRDDALVVGAMAGYLSSYLNFRQFDTRANFQGGSVGAYASYLNNNLFADLLVKADIMSLGFTLLAVPGTQSTGVQNYGASLNTGYRFNVGANAFIEPLATLAYVHTHLDGLNIGASTVTFNDGDGLRGRLGARFGNVWTTNGYGIENSLTASVWDEFLGNNAARIVSNVFDMTTIDNTNRPFGELSAMVSATNLGTGLSGFVKADFRWGSDLIGGGIRAGIRGQW